MNKYDKKLDCTKCELFCSVVVLFKVKKTMKATMSDRRFIMATNAILLLTVVPACLLALIK